MGVIGNQCQEITKSIEEKLGDVTKVEPKPEFYQQKNTQKNVTLQHNKDQT